MFFKVFEVQSSYFFNFPSSSYFKNQQWVVFPYECRQVMREPSWGYGQFASRKLIMKHKMPIMCLGKQAE